MKLFFRLLSVASLLAAGLGAAAPSGAPLRVMSFNVRYGTAPDGENAWPKRTELFFATIARFQPDLIGFQEVIKPLPARPPEDPVS